MYQVKPDENQIGKFFFNMYIKNELNVYGTGTGLSPLVQVLIPSSCPV
jgi:hypothetical protein